MVILFHNHIGDNNRTIKNAKRLKSNVHLSYFLASSYLIKGSFADVKNTLPSLVSFPVSRFVLIEKRTYESWYEISNNVVCATSKASGQPVHTRSLIRAFASRLNIL